MPDTTGYSLNHTKGGDIEKIAKNHKHWCTEKPNRRDSASTMLATSYQQTPDADWASILLDFLILMRQRRSDMTETDITSPKGDIEGSRRRALIDIQINMKGGR
jgi:hypothetical protein